MRTGSLERKNNKFQIEKQCDIIRTIFIIKSDRSVNVQMTASLLIAVIYLIFISLGLPDSLLGSGWPTMQMYFDVPSSYAGYVSMTISFMTIISALMSPKLISRIHTKWIVICSILLTIFGLCGFSVSSKYWMLFIFAVPYGLGAGAIDSAVNHTKTERSE